MFAEIDDLSFGIQQKGQTRFHGFDDKILSLYARGMTTRDLQKPYGESHSAI